MSKTIRIRRLCIRGDAVEAPPHTEGVNNTPLSVFERFPRSPGREAKSTPWDICYEHATGLITITHPTSGLSVQVPREHCYWHPFTAADEKRDAAESTGPQTPQAQARASA